MIEKLAGIKPLLEEQQIRATLQALGFAIEGKGAALKVTAPSWRPDVHGPADLVEEVVRIVGLDKVPSVPMPRSAGVARAVLTETQRRVRRARRVLAGRGLTEAITWSFIQRSTAKAFGGGQDALELAESHFSTDMSSMRPSLLPGLLAAVQRNRNRGFADLALFEVGQAYRGDAPEDQYIAASGVRAGATSLVKCRPTLGGACAGGGPLRGQGGCGSPPGRARLRCLQGAGGARAPAWFHPGRSGMLRLGPKVALAHFGELHPETLRSLDVAGPVARIRGIPQALPPQRKKGLARRRWWLPIPARPTRLRVRARCRRARRRCGRGCAVRRQETDRRRQRVRPLRGREPGAPGKKSLALEVTLQPSEKTLTDEEIDAVAAKVIAAVGQATGGTIRT